MKKSDLSEVLSKYSLHATDIQVAIKGYGLWQIVSGEIDVDRMDYLIRDAHYTGVAYGIIDRLHLLQKMTIHDEKLMAEAGGVQAALLFISKELKSRTTAIILELLQKLMQMIIVSSISSSAFGRAFSQMAIHCTMTSSGIMRLYLTPSDVLLDPKILL